MPEAEAGYTEGQPLWAVIDADLVEVVFVRPGEPEEAVWVDVKAATPRKVKKDVGWVRREDTGEEVAVVYKPYLSPRSTD